MVRYILACFACAACVGPVAACINDVELPQHEREFRSQYKTPASNSAAPTPQASGRNTGLLVGGAVLLTAAVALTVVGTRVRN